MSQTESGPASAAESGGKAVCRSFDRAANFVILVGSSASLIHQLLKHSQAKACNSPYFHDDFRKSSIRPDHLLNVVIARWCEFFFARCTRLVAPSRNSRDEIQTTDFQFQETSRKHASSNVCALLANVYADGHCSN